MSTGSARIAPPPPTAPTTIPIASPSRIARAVTVAIVAFSAPYRIAADDAAVCSRLPLMLRALVLVPLLAAGLDQARASFAVRAGRAELPRRRRPGLARRRRHRRARRLHARHRGAGRAPRARARRAAAAVGRRDRRPVGRVRRPGGPAPRRSAPAPSLGGGWVPLLAIGAAAGALLALALRVVPALARALRLVAPRLVAPPEIALLRPALALAAARAALRPPRARSRSTRLA